MEKVKNTYELNNIENEFLFESILYNNIDIDVKLLEVIKNSDVKIRRRNIRLVFNYLAPKLNNHLSLMNIKFSSRDKQKEFIEFNKGFDQMMYENYGMETRASYIINKLKEK